MQSGEYIVAQAKAADEKERALKALAYAERPALVQRTLALALALEVRSQDAPALLRDVASRGGTQLDAAWSFLCTYAACFGAMKLLVSLIRHDGAAGRRWLIPFMGAA